MRPSAVLDLPIALDRTSAAPLSRQLADALRTAVVGGALPPGAQVPATRSLAATLAVSRSTVQGAFDQLLGEGVLTARHGAGTFVADAVVEQAAPVRTPVPAPRADVSARIDLRPGRPDTSRLADGAWRAAWRAAAAEVPSDEPPAAGIAPLRTAIARHVAVARGLVADPDRVVVGTGTRELLTLLVRSLGPIRIGVEDPGYAAARRTLEAAGATTVPCPVDEQGLVVDRLPDGLDAVVVTPNHQYPLGGTLSLTRRAALIRWSHRTGALVIEDDYDGEFRYDVAPLPPLAALEPDAVVHLGTFAKAVTPWVRCAYAIAPARCVAALLRDRAETGQPVDGVVQSALATLLASGALARHVARSRRDHAHRRRVLLDLLRAHPGLVPVGSSAGLHLVVRLPPGTPTPAVLRVLAADGVLLADLDDYRVASAGDPAVVLGYGAAGVLELEEAVAALARAVRGAATEQARRG